MPFHGYCGWTLFRGCGDTTAVIVIIVVGATRVVRRYDTRAVGRMFVEVCALARMARQAFRARARITVNAVYARSTVFTPLRKYIKSS